MPNINSLLNSCCKTGGAPFFLIAGPCVLESKTLAEEIAGVLKEICEQLSIVYIFKSSYDKANRSSGESYRGLGLEKGLEILASIRKQFNLPVLTDVHGVVEVLPVASVVDVLQIPAFLCRQTDLIEKCSSTGKIVNIKKGQFLSPHEMKNVIKKASNYFGVQEKNPKRFWACERGVSFGYNNLIVDMRSLVIMKKMNVPIVFDATHSVQLPGAMGVSSGGQREFVPSLARAALAVGVDGLFIETHPDPEHALSDGANSVKLSRMKEMLEIFLSIDNLVKQSVYC